VRLVDDSPTKDRTVRAGGHTGDETPVTRERVLDILRRDGGRITEARRAVVEALLDTEHHHITADELAARVRRRYPEVHRTTVYRTLDRLEDNGIVSHTHLGHGPSTFHLTDHPHHHAVCRSCSAVVELPPGALDELAAHLREQHGWTLTPQHFALSALCPDCA
jgi:Fur family transcriptional regulator, ferric uptake regulator